MIDSNKKVKKVVTYYEDGTVSEWSPKDITPYMPSIPLNPAPYTWPYPSPNTFPKSTCTKCGLVLEAAMSYCCPHGDCPCGMGPVMCKVD